MASPATIRNALQTRLATIAGLRVYAQYPSQMNVPCAVLIPLVSEPEQTFGRGDLSRYEFDVALFVSAAGGMENAQTKLDPYLATSSTGGVFGAVAADRTLGGAVAATFVKGLSEYGLVEAEAGEQVAYMRATVKLECWST